MKKEVLRDGERSVSSSEAAFSCAVHAVLAAAHASMFVCDGAVAAGLGPKEIASSCIIAAYGTTAVWHFKQYVSLFNES